mmetsp:Transcript_56521/g.127048  ORF Transcript_56521/g.127048 Transcript_56521/m.127048 type:complete len:347 (+) Transcript_56521:46-1086(+)
MLQYSTQPATEPYMLPRPLRSGLWQAVILGGLVGGSMSLAGAQHGKHQEDVASEVLSVSLRQLTARRFVASSTELVTDAGSAPASLQAALTQPMSVLCSRKKWLPELYVLGAPKAATTSLAWELVHNGIPSTATMASYNSTVGVDEALYNLTVGVDQAFQREQSESSFMNTKEWYFALQWVVNHDFVWDPAAAKEDWFRSMPACPVVDSSLATERKLFAEYNPGFLSMVGDSATLGGFGSLIGVSPNSSVNLPAWMQMLYGPLITRLTFVVMLREPLSAMQSSWYHARTYKDSTGKEPMGILGVAAAHSFLSQLQETMEQFEQGHVSLWLWHVAYGTQLRQYLSFF